MKKELKEKVDFDLIRYANCWEDAEVLLEGLNAKVGSKILSIGSAGDNSFSLLTTEPELVVAVDINKIQLYLIELKKACFQALTHKETIAFLGFRDSDERENTFEKLKPYLKKETCNYWMQNMDLIQKGIIAQGKFEKYFQLFSQKVLPLIHSKSKTEALMRPKNTLSQKAFYHKYWNTWRWKSMFKIFFSKYVMGKFGRDPQFFNEVKVPVGDYIFDKAEQHLESVEAQDNFILRYALTGSFGQLLPHYLQVDNFEKIKNNIDNLHIIEGYAEEGIQQFGKFDYMNLSNIFEYMDSDLFADTAKKLTSFMESGSRIAYWNLMVPRKISKIFPERLEWLETLSKDLLRKDKGFFYHQFIVEQIK